MWACSLNYDEVSHVSWNKAKTRFSIKSLLLSYHHSTCALVSEILESVLQTVQKQLIYRQYILTDIQMTMCNIHIVLGKGNIVVVSQINLIQSYQHPYSNKLWPHGPAENKWCLSTPSYYSSSTVVNHPPPWYSQKRVVSQWLRPVGTGSESLIDGSKRVQRAVTDISPLLNTSSHSSHPLHLSSLAVDHLQLFPFAEFMTGEINYSFIWIHHILDLRTVNQRWPIAL